MWGTWSSGGLEDLENIWKHFLIPDEERDLVVLAGVKYSIPADVGNIDGINILHQVSLGGGGHDGGAPDLELLHLAAEPQLQQPVLGGFGEPALVQDQFPNESFLPGVSFLYSHPIETLS